LWGLFSHIPACEGFAHFSRLRPGQGRRRAFRCRDVTPSNRRRRRIRRGIALATALASFALVTAREPGADAAASGAPALSIRVKGNRLVDGTGKTVRLLGVNRPGMDVRTASGECWSIPPNPAEITALAAWKINAVRIPLNQDCWLGINGVSKVTGGAAYQRGLHRYVDALHARGWYVVLDLHRSAPGRLPATFMQAMPDASHSPAFWSSVAKSFKNDKAVLFDLYNEPHLADVLPEGSNYWKCWRSGCVVPIVYSEKNGQRQTMRTSWRAAGMQQLINAVRSTGSKQPVLLEGLAYGNRLSATDSGPISWLTYKPVDPAGQLVASVHVYNEPVGCVNLACWNQQYAAVARQYPVVTGEFGQAGCAHDFMDKYMKFADSKGISYLAWSWSLEKDCRRQAGMSLITDWTGTPSSSGRGFRAHLAALAR
jgi:endoglucanase